MADNRPVNAPKSGPTSLSGLDLRSSFGVLYNDKRGRDVGGQIEDLRDLVSRIDIDTTTSSCTKEQLETRLSTLAHDHQLACFSSSCHNTKYKLDAHLTDMKYRDLKNCYEKDLQKWLKQLKEVNRRWESLFQQVHNGEVIPPLEWHVLNLRLSTFALDRLEHLEVLHNHKQTRASDYAKMQILQRQLELARAEIVALKLGPAADSIVARLRDMLLDPETKPEVSDDVFLEIGDNHQHQRDDGNILEDTEGSGTRGGRTTDF